MRLPGIEPGLEAWEAPVIAAGPQPHIFSIYQSDRAEGEMDAPSSGATLAVLDHSRTLVC